MNLTFVTGNPGKVAELRRWLGYELPHRDIDVEELQEVDPVKVIEHKVREAYKIIGSPVLIEDVSVVCNAMGLLPGTYIKWFLQELGVPGICKMVDGFGDRSAYVKVIYCYFDGKKMELFENTVNGSIAPEPKGTGGFGWNAMFIPDGSDKTYAELYDTEWEKFAVRPKAVAKLKKFLDKLEA